MIHKSKKCVEVDVFVKKHVGLFFQKDHGNNPVSFYNTIHEMGLKIYQQTAPKIYPLTDGEYIKLKIKVRREVVSSQSILFDENKLWDLIPRYLEYYFGEQLVNWIISARSNVQTPIKIKEAIASFKKYYGLDEDTYSTEACKQVWQRAITKSKVN